MSSMQQNQNTDEHQDNNNDFITEIGPDDVLLGRGNHAYNRGNEKFRQIVQSRSLEYWSYKDNTSRDNVVRQIIESIHSRQGRFLRKVAHSTTTAVGAATTNANPPPASDISNAATAQWEIAETTTIMVKIKQTLRDMTASMRKRAISSSSTSQQQQQQQHPQSQQQESRKTMIQQPQIPSNRTPSITVSNLSKSLPPSDNHSILLDSMTSITSSSSRNVPDNDLMFESARLSQLGYLLQSTQQRQEQQNTQDQQLMILLEQQRTKLLEQLEQQQQQSTPSQSYSGSHQPQSTIPQQQQQQQQQQQHLSSNFSLPVQGEMTYRSNTAVYPSLPNIPSQTSTQITQMDLVEQYRALHHCDQGFTTLIPQQQNPMSGPSLSSCYPGINNSEQVSLDVVVSQSWFGQHQQQQQQQHQQLFALQQQLLLQQRQQLERGRLLMGHNESVAMHANQEVLTNQMSQSSFTTELNPPNSLSFPTDQYYREQHPFDHTNTKTSSQLLPPMGSSSDYLSQPIIQYQRQQQQHQSQSISSALTQAGGLDTASVPNTATNWTAHLNSFPQSFIDHVPMSSIAMTENEQQQQQQQPSPEKTENRIYRSH